MSEADAKGGDGSSRKWPEFPTVSSEHEVRLTRESAYRAWVGDVARLSFIETHIENSLRSAYEDYIANSEQVDDESWTGESAVEFLRLRTSVTANHGRMTRTGAIAAVLADMDPREVEKIAMGNETPDKSFPSISLRMQKEIDNNYRSVRISVMGSDRQWVAGVHDVLATEIRRGVPPWAFMRSPLVGVGLAVAITLGVCGILAFVGWLQAKDLALVLVGSLFVGGLFIGFPLAGLLARMFPGLEVVEAGGTPRGRQMLAWIGTGISLVIGIAGLILGIIAL